jgi:guanine deaminase
MSITLAIQGTAFHATAPTEFTVLRDYLFLIDDQGQLDSVLAPSDETYQRALAEHKDKPYFLKLKPSQCLLPGFVDTHIHAPQWPQAGKALHVDLPTWLSTYTFPLETSFKNSRFAKTVYTDLIKTLLANGTTTGLYFGSVHNEPNKILANAAAHNGQRAFIGKVVMDDPSQCPDFYRDPNTEAALEATEEFLQFAAELNKKTPQTISGVVTPRFIPTCTDEVLYGLGKLAKQYNVPVQSHVSEGDWQHNYVLQRTGKRDTKAHLDFGLLTDRTVLAHGVFLNDEDAEMLKATGASVAHSPISNVLFANAVAPIRHMLEHGVSIGLATDISGGYSPSMFDAMRQAILSSRSLEDGINPALPTEQRGVPNSRIDFRHAFYMATAGGAMALKLNCGHFTKGSDFDAFIFDNDAPHSNLRRYDFDTDEDWLQKIVFMGQRQNIVRLWVQGRMLIENA